MYKTNARTTELGYGVIGSTGPVEQLSPIKQIKDPTAFDALYQAAGGVGVVRARLEALAARFFGPEPEADCGYGIDRNSGLINDVAHTADTINSAVNQMHDILNRIERALP